MQAKDSNAEFAIDLKRAIAACNEVEYLILLAKDLEHLKPEVADSLTEDLITVRKMAYGLLRKM